MPDRKAFYRWLPLKKCHTLKKMIKNFWKERLPKEKLLTGLYYQLESHKIGILSTYRKLLVENDIVLLTTPEKERILSYIDTNLAVQFIPEEEPETEELKDVLPPEENDNTEKVKLDILPEKQPELKSKPSVEKVNTVSVQKRKTGSVPEGRGFREKNNKMSHKKAVTCAVCVAAAGALLVPLVAYTVIKHKS